MIAKAKLYGVSVDPGDIELLTLNAARRLNEVKVIAYPSADGGESPARRIVAPLIPEGASELPVSIPMERVREPARAAYDKAAEGIAAHLTRGQEIGRASCRERVDMTVAARS